MIIVKMIGGLGNQMFQYAYARHLQNIYNDEIVLDISAYETYTIRDFSLNNLNIKPELITNNVNEIFRLDANYKKIIKRQKKYRAIQKIKRDFFKEDEFGKKFLFKNYKKGEIFNFSPYYYELPKIEHKNKYIYGYFQTDAYFKKIDVFEDFKINTDFNFHIKEYRKYIVQKESVGISIRWGNDYKKLKNFNICNVNYYYDALNEMRKRLKKIEQLVIFTDDVNSVKKDFDFSEFSNDILIIENAKDYESLYLMSMCHHFIISNSSFSWWGSYLSKENTNKVIISPDKWYRSHAHMMDIYTDNMIKIKTMG